MQAFHEEQIMFSQWATRLNYAIDQVLLHLGLLVLRAGFGLMMLLGHGWDKLIHFGQVREKFPDPIGLGPGISLALCVFAEVFCSALVTIGLLTRLALVPLIINMLVAVMVIHAADEWAKRELACVYLTVYIALMLTGPGMFALDRVLWRRRSVPH
jgi:putative oxidoreductase